jgi:hypothetical protein
MQEETQNAGAAPQQNLPGSDIPVEHIPVKEQDHVPDAKQDIDRWDTSRANPSTPGPAREPGGVDVDDSLLTPHPMAEPASPRLQVVNLDS